MRNPRTRFLGLLATLLACALVVPALAQADPTLPPGFQDEVVFSGIDQPTTFRFAPDGRVFVAEKRGRILVYENLQDKTPEVFADLRGDVYDNGDRGLLGLALDPKFDEGRPYVYALYTWDHVLGEPWDPAHPKYGTPGTSGDPGCPSQNSSAACLVSGRLVRLEQSPLNPNRAVESGGRPVESELLQGWCQQFSSHSIGDLQFGPEGALYVSGGDGASYESVPDYGQLGTPPNPCGDPPTPAGTAPPVATAEGGSLRAQNLKLLNGAILRVDPDTGNAFPGNPLAASANENTRRTIAKGFRNPFRFAIDEATGELYSGNVGSSEIEEIDRFPIPPTSLYNSGWPCYEGIEHQFQFRELGLGVCEALYDTEPTSTSMPFFSYSHRQSVSPEDECTSGSQAAIGGIAIYRGEQFPAAYKGALFFADSVRGCFWVMRAGADGKPDPSTTTRFLREGKIYPGVDITEGPGGYLYYADLLSEEGLGDGAIHRIAWAPDSPTARLEAEPPYGLYNGANKFQTTLNASASTDPNGHPLDFEWDLNEDGVFEAGGSTKALTFTKAEQESRESGGLSPNRVIAVRVKDDEGFTSTARVTVYPGDEPPTPMILHPTSSERWKVGDQIKLEGTAVDAHGNGIYDQRRYYWITRLAHCPDPAQPTACHVHPLQTFNGVGMPEFVAPQHEYPSYIEVQLRVSDERDLSGLTVLKFDPQTVMLNMASDPPGIELRASSTAATAPFGVQAIAGSENQLSAPPTAQLGGTTYDFSSWSDGGAREHAIVANADGEYIAHYVAAPDNGGGGEEGGGNGGGGNGGGGGNNGGGGSGGDGGGAGNGGGSGSGTGTTPGQGPTPPASDDSGPPNGKLGSHPARTTRSRTARFVFTATVAGATYRCKLDRKPARACFSPQTYKGLRPGRHTLTVTAVSLSGATDPTPVKFSWTVLRARR